jgi:hypothetical protein
MNGRQGGVPVPGGIVTIDLYRGMNPVLWWIWTVVQVPLKGPNWVGRIKRDLVISDESGSRELYREGPYNNITVVNPLEQVLAEIRADGLDQFLFKRQAEESRHRSTVQNFSSDSLDRRSRISLLQATIDSDTPTETFSTD